MATISVVMMASIVLVLPSTCHRLITHPYLEQQYDSIVVSSDPITIKEKKQNLTTPLKPDHILKPQKRSYDECPENDFTCLYGNNKSSNKVLNKFLQMHSNAATVEFDPDKFSEQENSRNSYWTGIDSQALNTHDGIKGWVTLDPVPWSTSKISKWRPNQVVSQDYANPSIYQTSTQPSIQQFWTSGSNFHVHKPISHWGNGASDIITDNRPNTFPTGHNQPYKNPNQHTLQEINYPHREKVNYHRGNSFDHYHLRPPQGAPPKHQESNHPSTYPNNGNGEWVLLSATKGYSHLGRHKLAGSKHFKTELRSQSSRDVKPVEISRYHEENLSDKLFVSDSYLKGNRKSDETANSSTSKINGNEKSLQILYTGQVKNKEPTAVTRRKVKLQVLPALEGISTVQGGLLEVQSESQTVDEAQEEDEKLKNLKAIANVKRNKIRGYRVVPASKLTGKSATHKNVMTLAAVGAGMIPATMAVLVPMALGRRKRSSSQLLPLDDFHVRKVLGNGVY